jgi:hypothetical protein
LKGANFKEADLSGCSFDFPTPKAVLQAFKQLPKGDLIVYKKVNNADLLSDHIRGYILKLKIPAKAKRTRSLASNKCRAEFAKVIAWRRLGDSQWKTTPKSFRSINDDNFVYKMGEIAKPDSYDPDICLDCTNGIHFFVNESDAANY